MTPSHLRKDLYNILDKIIETGHPIEINRKGKILKIVPPPIINNLDNLKKHDTLINCEPEDIVHMDWLSEWKPHI